MSEQLQRPQLDKIITLLDQLIEELTGQKPEELPQTYSGPRPIITEEEINHVLQLLQEL